jgi:elongation factor P
VVARPLEDVPLLFGASPGLELQLDGKRPVHTPRGSHAVRVGRRREDASLVAPLGHQPPEPDGDLRAPAGLPGHDRRPHRLDDRNRSAPGKERPLCLAFVSVISTNQFKNGTHIEVDGTIYKIVEFQHVKPGKGGAFVRTKLKRSSDGAVIDKTFRAGEKFRPVRTESRKMQFLYADGSDAHLMDLETYEQITVPEGSVEEALRWIVPNENVDVLYVDEEPADLQVPSAVELAVTETEPGVRGDTASGGGDKPAQLESGVTVRVPLFVNVGDRVRVDTRSGEYVSRA